MSKSKNIWMSIWLLALIMLASGCTKCVKFDPVPLGTEWGTPAGHSSGDVVHAEDNIKVSVYDFYWSATRTHLGKARVGRTFVCTGGHAINTNNINLEFDFTFSEQIEVTLGVTNKKIRDLTPGGIIEIPLTIMGKKLGEAIAKVQYTYSDAKNQIHKRKGKVTLEVIRTKVKKKEDKED